MMTCESCSSTKSERLDSPRRMASMCAETTTKPTLSSARRSISTMSSLLLKTATVVGPGIGVDSGQGLRRDQSGFVPERQSQRAIECHVGWIEKAVHADRNRGLRDVEPQAPMQPVPPRQEAREVRVG